ncbi:MAG TPA: AAA family ATPase [Blastocatellia bacterium]|jgi:serine/threonine protein kinase/tetratricopeptide (TPR) repeat protein|nr:AAA family ATPase [Blastocatellia bacterium]
MTPERHEEIGGLFHAALELDPSERTGFLRHACADDDDLYQQVSSLLILERTAEDFIEVPVWQTHSEPLDDSNSPREGKVKYCPRCQRRYPGRQRICPEDDQRLSLPDPYHLVGRILADKYRIEALVGIGGMGAVYNAYHLGIDRPVAFKILQPNVAISNDRMVNLFEREAKVVGHLYHENIADIKDAGRASDGIAYIIMEWLDGYTLDEELAASAPFAMERAAGILRQISAALEAAHAKQIVHCDLKPSNIMLNTGPAGRELVKVLDFGIAKIMTDPAGSLVSAAMGTPHYASPEQLQVGRTVDARSDIYSLGVILFQMLTGKLPFQAGSVRELINRQMEAPARISELRPETPVAIQRIVNQMLAIEPGGRPQSASGVSAIVDQAMRDRIETQSVAPAPGSEPYWNHSAGPAGPSVRRLSVGREAECAELQASFESVAAGHGQLVCVTGEPGIGKTTVVEEFLNEASAGGRSRFIARGRCSERLEGTGAYLPLLEAMEGLIRSQKGPAREDVDRLMERTAPSWRAQITRRPLTPEGAEPPRSERMAASLEQMKWELKAFFQELSLRQPVVLFLDDIHWSDISTIDLLAFLGSKFDQLRMLIVVTYRPSELLLARSPFMQVMLDFQSRGLRREIGLRFFSRGEIERYLSVEFPGHNFPQEFPDFIQEKTEGNPLFMVDLIRYLRDRDVIHREGESWTLAEAIPDIGPELPESVRGMIQRKINQLDDADLRLLTAASVQWQEIDSAVLSKVLDIDSGQVEERLQALDEIHAFVRFVGEHELPDKTLTLRYRFVHGLYQNILYASLKPTRRAALSETTAAALLGFYNEKSHPIAADLALLFKAARKFSRAADYFLLAAQNAANVFAYQEAIELSRRGLESLKSLPDAPEQTNQEMRLQITLGMSLIAVKGYATPDVERAFTRARELCMRTEASPQVFPVLRGLSLFYSTRPKLDEARKLGEQLLRLAEGQQDTSIHMEALFSLSFTLFFMGEFAASLECAEREIDLDSRIDQTTPYDQSATIGCLAVASLALWALGFPDQALVRSRQGVTLARRLSQPFNIARSLAYEALLLLLRGDWNASVDSAREAINLSRQYGFSYWMAMASIYLGYTLFKQGQREEGIRILRGGLAAETATGAEIGRPYFLALLAEALAAVGQFDEGVAMIDSSFALVNSTSERFAHSDICRVKGELLLASQIKTHTPVPEMADPETAGQAKPQPASETDSEEAIETARRIYAEAEDFFRQAIESARIRQAKSIELRAVICLSRLLQNQGRKEEARQILSEICGWFTEGSDTMDLRTARALLSAF